MTELLSLLVIPKLVKVLVFVIFMALIAVKLIDKLADELVKGIKSDDHV